MRQNQGYIYLIKLVVNIETYFVSNGTDMADSI